MEQLHTNDNPDGGDRNHIVVQFQAILLDLGIDANGNAAAAQTDMLYYITAGVEYGNEEYVWIGQQEIKVLITDHVIMAISGINAYLIT